jgi:hypothetical protein
MPHHYHAAIETVLWLITSSCDTKYCTSHQWATSLFKLIYMASDLLRIDIHEGYGPIEILRYLCCHINSSQLLRIRVAVAYLSQRYSFLTVTFLYFLTVMVIFILFTMTNIILLRVIGINHMTFIVLWWGLMDLRFLKHRNFPGNLNITTVMKVFISPWNMWSLCMLFFFEGMVFLSHCTLWFLEIFFQSCNKSNLLLLC